MTQQLTRSNHAVLNAGAEDRHRRLPSEGLFRLQTIMCLRPPLPQEADIHASGSATSSRATAHCSEESIFLRDSHFHRHRLTKAAALHAVGGRNGIGRNVVNATHTLKQSPQHMAKRLSPSRKSD